jgi:hypothetical protein
MNKKKPHNYFDQLLALLRARVTARTTSQSCDANDSVCFCYGRAFPLVLCAFSRSSYFCACAPWPSLFAAAFASSPIDVQTPYIVSFDNLVRLWLEK